MILFLLACVHTPPHDAPAGAWKKEFVRREEMRRSGDYCAWEAESLTYGGAPVWSAEPPLGENWCGTPAEQSRMFDVVGQDGPFLSTRTTESGCCPDRSVTACVTWNLETKLPATLVEYDERRAEKRWAKAKELAAGPGYSGLTLSENSFVVAPGGHVAFCAVPTAGARTPEDIREILVK